MPCIHLKLYRSRVTERMDFNKFHQHMFFSLNAKLSVSRNCCSIFLLSNIIQHTMASSEIQTLPPECVRGMTELDKTKFTKAVQVVTVANVDGFFVGQVIKHLKKYLLSLREFKSIVPSSTSTRSLILDPKTLPSIDVAKGALSQICSDEAMVAKWVFSTSEIKLGYENWTADEILKAVLPPGIPHVSGFSLIGHIAHLNLKSDHEPFKLLIGQVLLDKRKNLETVVNKLDTIDNTFRNFEMEILAGKALTDVTVKENGCVFQFDFAKVYWNPRLGTEHERIVKSLTPGCRVYDVFAGVGPFAVPACKKGFVVHANDLNPDSYKSLKHNLYKNKTKQSAEFSTYNLDGREFIRTVMRGVIHDSAEAETPCPRVVEVVMNLPALAETFLDAFIGLAEGLSEEKVPTIKIHCYAFSKDVKDPCQDVAERINAIISPHSDHKHVQHQSVRLVRNVAPNKDMMCAEFEMPYIVLSATGKGHHAVGGTRKAEGGDITSDRGVKRARNDSKDESN